MKVKAGAYSSKGGRPHNEDAYLAADRKGGGGAEDSRAVFSGDVSAPLFFFVADGMGGHAAGDAASAFIAEKLPDAAAALTGRVLDSDSIEGLVKSVHAALLEEGKKRGTPDMGSTVSGIVVQDNAPCGVFNAGDSRTYRLRNGIIQQLTRDDSLAGIVPGASKNIITNAVGAGFPNMTVASRFSPSLAVGGDVFCMCCDGVHGFVDDDGLEHLLAAPLPPEEIAKRIVEKAVMNNSDDNCTAVVVKIEEEPCPKTNS
jgi:protein phosphatase